MAIRIMWVIFTTLIGSLLGDHIYQSPWEGGLLGLAVGLITVGLFSGGFVGDVADDVVDLVNDITSFDD